jgi:hypothetical protein
MRLCSHIVTYDWGSRRILIMVTAQKPYARQAI